MRTTLLRTLGALSLVSLIALMGCDDSDPTDPVAEATQIAVSPETIAFTGIGASETLRGFAFDASGHYVPGAPMTWSSSNVDVATVDAFGRVEAIGPGEAVITVTSGNLTAEAVVTVPDPTHPHTVNIVPDAGTITIGETLELTAFVYNALMEEIEDPAEMGFEVVWSSTFDWIASVDANGVVEGLDAGIVQIFATSGDASGYATITVVR